MFQAGFALVFPEFSQFFFRFLNFYTAFCLYWVFSGFSLEWLGPSYSKSTKFVV